MHSHEDTVEEIKAKKEQLISYDITVSSHLHKGIKITKYKVDLALGVWVKLVLLGTVGNITSTGCQNKRSHSKLQNKSL